MLLTPTQQVAARSAIKTLTELTGVLKADGDRNGARELANAASLLDVMVNECSQITPHPNMRYKVMRDCCTSGNCITCISERRISGKPYGGRVRVVQMDDLDKRKADRVADNWRQYNAAVVPYVP